MLTSGIVAVNIILVLIVVYLLSRSQRKQAPDNSMLLIQNQLNELVRTVDSKIGESSKQVFETMRNQSGQSAKLIADVTERLTRLDETNRQVVNFADQLQSLQDILKNPKQRGTVLGEYYLETLLKNVLPPTGYQMQYRLGRDEKTGQETIVDAAVFVKDKIIPVDSKFSLENYNRMIEEKNDVERARLEKLFVADLKNRIVETAKYIQPSQNTMDFAFMFIPHEAIYYDLLVNKIGALKTEDTENLIQRAAGTYKVIIVSPTSFLAYLQTVLQGLRAMQIEETAKDVVKRVEELGRHLKAYEEYHGKLGKALETTVNHFNATGKEFKKIDKDVLRISGVAAGVEIALVDKPEILE